MKFFRGKRNYYKSGTAGKTSYLHINSTDLPNINSIIWQTVPQLVISIRLDAMTIQKKK